MFNVQNLYKANGFRCINLRRMFSCIDAFLDISACFLCTQIPFVQ